MKKKVLNALMAMFVLCFVIAMTSCNKDAGTNDPTSPMQPQTTSVIDQTVLPDGFLAYFDAHQVIVTGSLETPIQNSSPDFCPPPDTGRGHGGPPPPPPPDSGKGGPPPDGGGNGCPGGRGVGAGPAVNNGGGFELRGILYQLKLTKDEMPVIQKAIWDYQQCVQQVLSKTFAARKEIMYAAEQQRRTIMNTYMTALKAAGRDTALIHAARKAAMDAMGALNKDTQTKLAALIDTAALCQCWTTMINAIEATLTADQLTLFKAWLAKQKTPCDATTTNG
jgi:hypothetical protein